MDIQKEKEELIEMFGIHFETLHNLPPLASRILGMLITECNRDGMTFDNVVDRMDASKSSVSTSLNLLQKLGKITYHTLPGDRKKYYRSSPFSERFENYERILQFEKKLIDRMISYREKTKATPEENGDLENIKAYKSHILEIERLMVKTINKFKEIEKENNKN